MNARQKRGHEDSRRRPERDRGRDSSSDDSPPPVRHERGHGRTGLQNYWINGEKINREVLQRQICLMLGAEARSKPDKYKGIDGYRITAVRPFTERQLEDLEDISQEFEKEIETYKKKTKKNYDVPYIESKTGQRHDHDYASPVPRTFAPDASINYTAHTQGPMDGHPAQQIYGQPHVGAYTPHTQGGYPPAPAHAPAYAVPGFQGGRQPYREQNMRPQDVPPYYIDAPDEMDIDAGPQYGHPRQTPGFSQPGPPAGYPDLQERRPNRGDPYMPPNPYGAPQQNPFGADRRDPRYAPPHMEPPGRFPPDMPQEYGYRPQPEQYPYKAGPVREEKRPRHDEHDRDRRRR